MWMLVDHYFIVFWEAFFGFSTTIQGNLETTTLLKLVLFPVQHVDSNEKTKYVCGCVRYCRFRPIL
ncbi:hypothetical protein PsorP6_016050 [Peronosclerospora sorghi]|uniref:Uncharacterized protein n=1 Tax=Peronosclerospora sorghi TaxID=230839 RepID=A0ACC0WPJ7_9STRA|nr:hypothetical protein PsorP6_016050 [Peronosclerospora sorghi]